MLSQQLDITSGRLLCKFLTGRTSSKSLSAINKAIRNFSPDYILEATKIVTKAHSPKGKTYVQFAINSFDGTSLNKSRSDLLFLPTSPYLVIKFLCDLDDYAEKKLKLEYAAEAPPLNG